VLKVKNLIYISKNKKLIKYSSSITLKQGVEKMMTYYVEEVTSVVGEEE
jgi:hypothetical protein